MQIKFRRTSLARPNNRSSAAPRLIASLIEVGWSNLSIGAIAARAGVHETSIYRRWKTKEELVVSALLERLNGVLPVPDTGSLRDELVTMLRGLLKFLRLVWRSCVHSRRKTATGIDSTLRATLVTLYEIRRLASRCPSRESLLLVHFSIALKEEIVAL